VEHQVAANHRWVGGASNQPIKRKNRGERNSRRSKHQVFTPLTTNRTKMLEETFNAELITFLPPKIDRSKYYWYHRNYGHTTKACKTPRDKIEELVQASYLRKFVKRVVEKGHPKEKPKTSYRRNETSPRRNEAQNLE
ncbi:hypothetical protein CR513_21040, partial [Mucuna pruriens]